MSENTGFHPENPLIVQSDHTLLLEVHTPRYEQARVAISTFAELEKSPEHIHTYRITPLSLWNAASAGVSVPEMTASLLEFAKYPVPQNVLAEVRDLAGRWGRLQLQRQDGELVLSADEATLLLELSRHGAVGQYLGTPLTPHACAVPRRYRGVLKQALMAIGWPVEDLAGYVEGTPLQLALRHGHFVLRDYQRQAAEAFYMQGTARGGVALLCCRAGRGRPLSGWR
jgi:DNA excision repair protein ERCC-3